MTTLDFSQPHPATALWWRQREKCRACAHHTVQREVSTSAERCAAVPVVGKAALSYCIDARLDGAACGLRARLFVPIEVVA